MRLLALVAWAVASLRDRRITPLLFDIAAKRLAMGNVPQDLEEMGRTWQNSLGILGFNMVQVTTFPILCITVLIFAMLFPSQMFIVGHPQSEKDAF